MGGVYGGGAIDARQQSTFLLLRMRYAGYFMMFSCIYFMGLQRWIFKNVEVSKFVIKCSCTAPLTSDVPNFNNVCSRIRLLCVKSN